MSWFPMSKSGRRTEKSSILTPSGRVSIAAGERTRLGLKLRLEKMQYAHWYSCASQQIRDILVLPLHVAPDLLQSDLDIRSLQQFGLVLGPKGRQRPARLVIWLRQGLDVRPPERVLAAEVLLDEEQTAHDVRRRFRDKFRVEAALRDGIEV
ncbi:unnamed protein product [Clonostachys rosea]|uniref:Uncharacterized protein n=1 Tax=Bionectria ochroleuca TaxID=29856 RepID=A0ABY6U1C7_BIOOC|nr:unnamed protein product [Clonostachys rosea]